jgi:hypothetical protein
MPSTVEDIMPTLYCYIPFARGGKKIKSGCLRTNAAELIDAGALPDTSLGTRLTECKIIYRGEENRQITPGDVLVVHAHGGPDDSDLADNSGEHISCRELMTRIELLNGGSAAEAYFFACYSALPHHAAAVFKQRARTVRVFGTTEKAEGGLVQRLRSGTIKAGVWSLGQLREV